jgi:hypothetical protein
VEMSQRPRSENSEIAFFFGRGDDAGVDYGALYYARRSTFCLATLAAFSECKCRLSCVLRPLVNKLLSGGLLRAFLPTSMTPENIHI